MVEGTMFQRAHLEGLQQARDQQVEQMVPAALSAALFVDGRYAGGAAGGDQGGPAYLPLPEQEPEQISRFVQTAVGPNPARGEQIEVVGTQMRKAQR